MSVDLRLSGPAADPPIPGLLAPFRVREGLRALHVGCGDGWLTAALAASGAVVLGLEDDPGRAASAGARVVGLAGARILETSLQAWVAARDPEEPGYDLVVLGCRVGGPAGRLEEAELDAAVSTVGAGGLLLVLADQEGGLGQDGGPLESPFEGPTEEGPGGPAPSGAAGHGDERPEAEAATPDWLRTILARRGFVHQRWYVAYPDRVAPRTIVSARLWAMPDGDRMVKALVRDATTADATEAPARDALEEFRHLGRADRWLAMADAILVAGAREQAALEAFVRDGMLWMLPTDGRVLRGGRTRELVEEGGSWSLRSVEPTGEVHSGPFDISDVPAIVPVGQNGEDVLTDLLLGWGPSSWRARDALRAWWEAATAAIREGRSDARQFDVRPRHFIVTPDGTWHFIPQAVSMRFPVPPQVLAYSAIVDLLEDRVVRTGWIPGLPPGTTLGEAGRAILATLDLELDSAHERLWVELVVDQAARSGATEESIDALQRAASARLTVLLERWLTVMPRSRPVAMAGVVTERVAEIERLEREVTRLMGEVASLQGEVTRLEGGGTRHAETSAGHAVEKADASRPAEAEAEGRLASDAGSRGQPDVTLDETAQERRWSGADLDRTSGEVAALRSHVTDREREVAALQEELVLERAWTARPRAPMPLRMLRALALRVFARQALRDMEASGLFDAAWYVEHYPDVARGGTPAHLHYLRKGTWEGRDPGPGFDTRGYLTMYPDVASGGQNPLLHYVRHGRAEGRRPGRPHREQGS